MKFHQNYTSKNHLKTGILNTFGILRGTLGCFRRPKLPRNLTKTTLGALLVLFWTTFWSHLGAMWALV